MEFHSNSIVKGFNSRGKRFRCQRDTKTERKFRFGSVMTSVSKRHDVASLNGIKTIKQKIPLAFHFAFFSLSLLAQFANELFLILDVLLSHFKHVLSNEEMTALGLAQ